MSFTDVGEPQPSTFYEPVVAPAPSVPLSGDSDWEDLDEVDDPDYFDDGDDAADSDCSFDELDRDEVTLAVSAHDTSIDSDELLSEVARRHAARSAPGSKGWKGWYKEENVPRRHAFNGSPGLREELGLEEEDSKAKEIFNCLFPPELWETMEAETSLYARQHPHKPSTHMKAWEETSSQELQKYIALHLLMGIQPRPTNRFYCSEYPVVNSRIFRETMTRDRYDLLTSNLHFIDNNDPSAKDDRLWKLRQVIDTLQSTFKDVFTPERKIAVDKLLWAYRGRHNAVQYNPSKRAHFGMKV
ncbi:piggyBac transposable element-derived protein 4-like [Penaeus japonicus]|uniref:piggyBac transposable element-derived protein 4-like n=1 Tax=Penaeus japonicus TaxID=27405 RepID=UPI001C70C4B6|nr:piggyBac transposable element-derived protein 4-like [Penaeus japonicus]